MSSLDFISYAKEIDVSKHIYGEFGATEETVKTKLVLPLIKSLGWDILSDVEFEVGGADIVLMIDRKASFIIETKSWEVNTAKYLDQCFEYSLKLRTPWVAISSGLETAVYCSMLSRGSSIDPHPLMRFSFHDLRGEKAGGLMRTIRGHMGKVSVMNGCQDLRTIVCGRLGGRPIADLEERFMKRADSYVPQTKRSNLTPSGAMAVLHRHPSPRKDALIALYEWMLGLEERRNVIVRYMTRVVELFYRDPSRSRRRDRGVFSLDPRTGKTAFGWKNLRELHCSEEIVGDLRRYRGAELQTLGIVRELTKVVELALVDISTKDGISNREA